MTRLFLCPRLFFRVMLLHMEAIKQLPKHILAMLVLAGGIFFIVVSDPPATVCGQQAKSFKEKQVGFLYKKPDESFRSSSRFHQLIDVCISSNTMGGCYELFQGIRRTLQDMRSFSLECMSDVGSDSTVRDFVTKSLDLLIRLSWGVKPPEAVQLKLNWLEPTEVSLFCQLKNQYLVMYDDAAWAQLREGYLKSLPGIEKLQRKDAWGLSLMSIDCSKF